MIKKSYICDKCKKEVEERELLTLTISLKEKPDNGYGEIQFGEMSNILKPHTTIWTQDICKKCFEDREKINKYINIQINTIREGTCNE